MEALSSCDGLVAERSKWGARGYPSSAEQTRQRLDRRQTSPGAKDHPAGTSKNS